MKQFILCILAILLFNQAKSQERVVKIDFETSSFVNTQSIPYDQPFFIEGEVYKEVEYVQVHIYHEGSHTPLHSFSWNRDERNQSETFSILIPGILKSNIEYDFEVLLYKRINVEQKAALLTALENRISFYLRSNYQFDGKSVSVSNPKTVFKGLGNLIEKSLEYHLSKNNIEPGAPTDVVLNKLKNQSEFKFKTFLRKTRDFERDSIANRLIEEKVSEITHMISAELRPFFNTDLVQHYRSIRVLSISTDKERFSLPVNVGMYAWNKEATVNNATVKNTNFTPGLGVTLPFSTRTSSLRKGKLLDSFGYSVGILFQPLTDANGVEYVTPGIGLPVYTGLGFRFFKVIRLNAGVLIVGEKGQEGFKDLSLEPTVGLSFELNVWMGIKK